MSYLDAAIDEVNQYRHAKEQIEQEEAKQKKEQAEQTAIKELRTLLEEFLAPEFREEVSLAYQCEYESHYATKNQMLLVNVRFLYLSATWQIQRVGDNTWKLEVKRDGSTYFSDVRQRTIESASLQAMIVYELGKHKEKMEEKAQQQVLQEAEWAEKDRRAKESEARRIVEQSVWREQANAEHQHLRTLFDEEKAKRVAALWQWVPGVTIEIYELQYCRGAIRDEDREVSFDYVEGWTSVSELGEHGRITLEATMPYETLREAKTVQLTYGWHLPTWMVHQYSSMEELPSRLRQEVTLELDHMVAKRDSELEGGIRLEHKESLGYDNYGYPEHWYSEIIGGQPLKWVRTLVEQAAQEETDNE